MHYCIHNWHRQSAMYEFLLWTGALKESWFPYSRSDADRATYSPRETKILILEALISNSKSSQRHMRKYIETLKTRKKLTIWDSQACGGTHLNADWSTFVVCNQNTVVERFSSLVLVSGIIFTSHAHLLTSFKTSSLYLALILNILFFVKRLGSDLHLRHYNRKYIHHQ